MTTASAKKKGDNTKVHTPQYMSVKVECVVCKHNWVSTLPYGPMPSYIECPECLRKEQEKRN